VPSSGLCLLYAAQVLDRGVLPLLAYANKKIEELDTRRQTISKAIAELSVETISPQQIKKLSYYLDNWDSIDFDDKRKAADGLISTIKATSDRVQIEWKI
jgi:site-specific DNA recombinase